LKLRLKQIQKREEISGQQEAQDLAPAVGKLNVSVGPARAENEYLLYDLIAGNDLLAGTRYLK
jgi:hypothetical protein